MHGQKTIDRVFALLHAGYNGWEVSRATGVHRRTIGRWKAAGKPDRRPQPARRIALNAVTEESYVYLLGLYLGDGHLVRGRRGVYRLGITLDAAYPGIIKEAADAVAAVLPQNRVRVAKLKACNAFSVFCTSKQWPLLFPQHGPGRKHERPIRLAGWQSVLVSRFPQALLRGLVHSDGSRYIARQRVNGRDYLYARYCFSNRSEDVLRIFSDALDQLDISWTRASYKHIQIARRDAVAALDEFVGPKS